MAAAVRCSLLLLAGATAAAPLAVLYESWLYLPHSYAIVSSLELIHLLRLYGPAGSASPGRLSVYVREPPFYVAAWEGKRTLAYDEEYNELLVSALPQWRGEAVDCVLRRAYPHDLDPWPGEERGVPLLLFFTSERGAALPAASFSSGGVRMATREAVAQRLDKAPLLRLLTPSAWSARGAASLGLNASIVPHGVDARLFHRLPWAARAAARARFGLRPSDFALLSVGAMTSNKGLVPLLAALHDAVAGAGAQHVQLLLKGVGELYDSRLLLESHLPDVLRILHAAAPDDEAGDLEASLARVCAQHVTFVDHTMPAAELNALYNAADLYAAPYLAEAFSLTPLEALRAGLPVMAPRGGGAAEYLAHLAQADGADVAEGAARFIRFLAAEEETLADGSQENRVEHADVARVLMEAVAAKQAAAGRGGDARPPKAAAARLAARIDARWSWFAVAEQLMGLFEELAAQAPRRRAGAGGDDEL